MTQDNGAPFGTGSHEPSPDGLGPSGFDPLRTWQPIATAPQDGTILDLWFVQKDGTGWRETDRYWNVGWCKDVGRPTRHSYINEALAIPIYWMLPPEAPRDALLAIEREIKRREQMRLGLFKRGATYTAHIE